MQGDGTLAGALSASPGMKQTTYICAPAHSGSNGLGVGESDVMPTLDTKNSAAVTYTQYGEEVCGTLTARYDSSSCADRGQNIICIADDNAKAAVDVEMSGTLKCCGSAPMVAL